MSDINKVLEERGNRYGTFMGNAQLAQDLKNRVHDSRRWVFMKPDQQEAIDNICQKIARLSNGDENYLDNWVDIIGYAQLVLDRLRQDENNKKT